MSRPQLKLPFIFTIVAVIATLSLLAPGPQDLAHPCTGCVQAHKTVSDDEDDGAVDEGTGEFMGGADVHSDDLVDGVEDEVAHLDDDAEFQIPGSSSMKSESGGAPQKTFASLQHKVLGFFKHEPEYYWIHYKLEFAMLTFALIVFYFFIDGKNSNAKLAISWCNHAVKSIKNEFEHIGCTQERNFAVMQRSYSEFDYFASGRKNLMYADFKLYLIRRQCVLTKYLYDGFKGHEDYLELSIPIDLGNRQLPLEFFICKRKDLKQKMTELSYLKDHVKNANAKHYRVPEQDQNKNMLMILCEHDEIANTLIDASIGASLVKYTASGMLNELHITDMQTYNNYNLFLRAHITLPSSSNSNTSFETHCHIIQTILHLIDNVAALRLSSPVQSKCDKSRKAIKAAAKEKREAEADDAKVDAKREEARLEKDKIKRMTPEEQSKYQEKQRRRDMKKQKGKLMKVSKA